MDHIEAMRLYLSGRRIQNRHNCQFELKGTEHCVFDGNGSFVSSYDSFPIFNQKDEPYSLAIQIIPYIYRTIPETVYAIKIADIIANVGITGGFINLPNWVNDLLDKERIIIDNDTIRFGHNSPITGSIGEYLVYYPEIEDHQKLSIFNANTFTKLYEPVKNNA